MMKIIKKVYMPPVIKVKVIYKNVMDNVMDGLYFGSGSGEEEYDEENSRQSKQSTFQPFSFDEEGEEANPFDTPF